ncbi:DUF2917 domain-containing protein [Variovorax sp. KK3]|uniref:DUF2917 domain-containing protein n=1 Tax=Variovorax sp. KK3 TaxID=1855728 RepID=UPI00097C922D|nr:DUF2917 domain-containing protein [Variovorax sp. KK3]
MSAVCTTTTTFPSSPVLAKRPATVPPAVRRGAWQLGYGEATSIKASSASILRVRQGRVWVTRDATAQWGSEDLVLAPGETLRIEAGERIVMEPWDTHGATYSWDAAA